MVSSDFPLGETSAKLYERQGSPVRQSVANLKHISEPQREYNQITGGESG